MVKKGWDVTILKQTSRNLEVRSRRKRRRGLDWKRVGQRGAGAYAGVKKENALIDWRNYLFLWSNMKNEEWGGIFASSWLGFLCIVPKYSFIHVKPLNTSTYINFIPSIKNWCVMQIKIQYYNVINVPIIASNLIEQGNLLHIPKLYKLFVDVLELHLTTHSRYILTLGRELDVWIQSAFELNYYYACWLWKTCCFVVWVMEQWWC